MDLIIIFAYLKQTLLTFLYIIELILWNNSKTRIKVAQPYTGWW
jgi:hypothetical protein